MSFFEQVGRILQVYWLDLLKGAGVTLWVSLVGTLIGIVIGLIIGVIRTIPNPRNKFLRGLQKVVNWILSAYVEVFRGTPMIVQAMVIFYGSAQLNGGQTMNAYFAAVLIVSINTGAYITEIMRGGIMSIDKGQLEGAKSVGMSHGSAMFNVVVPQTFKNILPALSNEFVVNIKDTSVLAVIVGFVDLYGASKLIENQTYSYFETYLICSVVYFILTFSITRILRLIEKKLLGKANYQLYNTNLISKVEENNG